MDDVLKYHFDSKAAGPHLVILGAIHGNETCGPNALKKIIADLEQGLLNLKKGRCTIVPVCNPRAYEQRVRFVEENLNRVFETSTAPHSYERKLAVQLCPIVAGGDYLLDLHSMQSSGDPFVFMNAPTEASQKFCRIFGVKWILEGWPTVYAQHPELLSSCTQTFADRKGIPNALVECGTHGDPKADDVAYDSVLRALQHLDMISPTQDLPRVSGRRLQMTELYVRRSAADHFPKTWSNFETFKRGEVLARRSDGEEILAQEDGIIILPNTVSAVGTEWFYTGRVIDPA